MKSRPNALTRAAALLRSRSKFTLFDRRSPQGPRENLPLRTGKRTMYHLRYGAADVPSRRTRTARLEASGSITGGFYFGVPLPAAIDQHKGRTVSPSRLGTAQAAPVL
jgi:hypothetical protein